jgi:hypothetical protein
MKIYVRHSTDFNFEQKLYQPLMRSRVSDRHEIILPHRSEFTNSKEIIMGCDLMVAEVSYPSTGLGIELGWAEEFNTDVVCIHRREEKPSKAIQVVTEDAESYRDEDEIINVIADNI